MAKGKPTKPRYYVRIQDGAVDLRTNPKPGHSYVWLIERDGAANEGRMHGCMLTQSAEQLVSWLESLGVEVQRARIQADAPNAPCIRDTSDKDLMPEVLADKTSRDLPEDVQHGKISPFTATAARDLVLDDILGDLL